MEFRRVDRDEIDKLVTLRMLYLREDFSNAPDAYFCRIEENLPAYFGKHLEQDLFAFAAFEQEKIVSIAILLVVEKPCNPRFPTGKTGDVMNVYTVQEYRRRGIAMQVMKMLLDFARELELDMVELKATKSGYSLYKKLGFLESAGEYVSMKYSFHKASK